MTSVRATSFQSHRHACERLCPPRPCRSNSYSADETTDLGTDTASGVTDDLDHSNVDFNGEVRWVQIDLGDAADDEDHLLSPEEQYRTTMTNQ